MRAALLLSLLCVICGVAAAFGVPAVWIRQQPVIGVSGFAVGLLFAAIPPSVVVVWRNLRGR